MSIELDGFEKWSRAVPPRMSQDERDAVAAFERVVGCAVDWHRTGDRGWIDGYLAARAERAERRTPPGYVLVPVEPTDEMVIPGGEAFFDAAGPSDDGDTLRDQDHAISIYRAMLAAAPPAPQAEQREPLKDADVLAHAARFGDAETDSRGRVTYSFDSYGLVALAAALVGAPKTAEQREPLTFNEFICLMDNSWMTSNDVQRDFALAGMVERAHGIGAPKTEEAK